jgi:hypothetical protein
VEEKSRLLERGAISFYYRPRVETFDPEGVHDVQRLLLVLCPDQRSRFRVIAIGRKRLPHPSERFWGFVDLVFDAEQDLRAALDAQTYGTKTRGVRHLPAARPAAGGTYQLKWHDGHAHFTYALRAVHGEDPVVEELEIAPRGEFIVTVANPDPAAWGLAELPGIQFDLFDEAEVHVTIPTPFPESLQREFGDHRFAQLSTTEFLDHPGAELVFIAPPGRAGAGG